ncbi:MAG: ABC transporter permease [Patescibacteria group bacterium]|nr:ABC transporter permease [Patescibacteria group bacterium]
MQIKEIIKTILEGFRANKIRAVLTILGIVIGIGSVIVIMSVGAGAQSLILNQVNSMGTDLIGILPGASDPNGPPATVFGLTITTLKYEDAQALRDRSQAPHNVAVSAYVAGVDTISSIYENLTGNFMGTSAAYPEVENVEVASGRFFTESEEKGLARVAVLGAQMKIDLFGENDPIGQRIKIKRESFEVIGVLAARGSNLLSDTDNRVFVPVLTAEKLVLGIDHLGFIRAKIDDTQNLDAAMDDIRVILRQRHGITNPADDDFSIRSTAQALDVLGQVTDAIRFFLAGIGALSLLVGGVGIMNIMLISVAERTREIGLRKALGARKQDLLVQFLAEASISSLTGGVVGIVGGVAISALIALVAQALGYNWSFVVSPASVILACAVSISIGMIFGYYPAKKASGLDPISALRYE